MERTETVWTTFLPGHVFQPNVYSLGFLWGGRGRNFAGTLCVSPALEVPGQRLRHFVLLGVVFPFLSLGVVSVGWEQRELFPPGIAPLDS